MAADHSLLFYSKETLQKHEQHNHGDCKADSYGKVNVDTHLGAINNNSHRNFDSARDVGGSTSSVTNNQYDIAHDDGIYAVIHATDPTSNYSTPSQAENFTPSHYAQV